MIKFCIDQWDKNKSKLEDDIKNNFKTYGEYDYKKLVGKVVEIVFNDEESEYSGDEYDVENITEIDNGDYQGTLLYLIPVKTYQPSESQYLMTHVSYGSCSGCDTLQSIQSDMYFVDEGDAKALDEGKKEAVKEYMQLCLHLIQNTIKPYNSGWRQDEKYEEFVAEKTNYDF